jgi:hypothetical protein
MSIASRLVPRSAKGILLTTVFGLLFVVAAWQGLRAWWLHGYSMGTRTGRVSKFSYKGSPLCKYWSGELLTSVGMAAPEVWTFTTDADRPDDPVIKAIEAAEASGSDKTTLQYRQDKGRWWSCAPTEYYVIGVQKP